MRRFILSYISGASQLDGRRIVFFCCWTLLLSVSCFSLAERAAAAGEEPSPPSPVPAQQSDFFEYVLDGRPDPFVPFITEKAAVSKPTVNMDEIIEKEQVLTGMQLFEPGQLTLVALLQSRSKDIAMVQDFTGKGYVLTEGTKIGRKGVVKDIAQNTVIIEETAETRAGKKIISEVVMTLKKEGEE